MFNTNDVINTLFKRIFGYKSNTNESLSFDEEPYRGRLPVLLQDVWMDVVPTTNPLSKKTYTTGAIYPTVNPIVKKWNKVELQPVTTSPTNVSFRSPSINTNIINSEYGDGSYQYTLWKKDVNGEYTIEIPYGINNWFFDPVNGVLTFFDGLPKGISASSLPAITCYQYVGELGNKENLGGGDLNSDSLDNVTIELNDEDKIQINNKYKTGHYYASQLHANANVVLSEYTINHQLESIMVDTIVYKNNIDATKDRVYVPWKVVDQLNVKLYFSPNVKSSDFSVLITSRY